MVFTNGNQYGQNTYTYYTFTNTMFDFCKGLKEYAYEFVSSCTAMDCFCFAKILAAADMDTAHIRV